MPDKSPRRATIKKPTQPIKQKRAATKVKRAQAARRDVIAVARRDR